jgi:hypothetical protein
MKLLPDILLILLFFAWLEKLILSSEAFLGFCHPDQAPLSGARGGIFFNSVWV